MPRVPVLKLDFPQLDDETAERFNRALANAQRGLARDEDYEGVVVSVIYSKVTRTRTRVPDVDYRPLLGADKKTLIGPVKRVDTGRDGPYILLDATLTRAPIDKDGEVIETKLGWTSIRPAGIEAVQVLKNKPLRVRRRRRQ